MKAFVAVLTVLLLIAPPQLRAANQVELRWSELGAFVVRGEVHSVLKDGTEVKGRVIAVNPDALVLDAKKKGRTSIPREQISTLNLREVKGAAGRIWVTIGAVLGAMFAIGYVLADYEGDGAGPGVAILGGAVGAGVGGYYAGKSIDRKTTVIRILPD